MAKLITKDGVTFYFGTRIFALMESEMGIDDMSQMAKRFSKPKFSDIAMMLFLSHENACFMQKKDLKVESVDHIYEYIDSIGLDAAQEIISEGMNSLMDIKAPASKKKGRQNP